MEQMQFEELTSVESISLSYIARRLRLAMNPLLIELGEVAQKITVAENKSLLSIKGGGSVAAQVKLQKKGISLWVKASQCILFPEINWQVRSQGMASTVFSDLDELLCYSYKLCELAVNALPVGEGFGCCHRYVECSDAKRCAHPKQLIALACAYRRNLEQGRIFYGKNRNI